MFSAARKREKDMSNSPCSFSAGENKHMCYGGISNGTENNTGFGTLSDNYQRCSVSAQQQEKEIIRLLTEKGQKLRPLSVSRPDRSENKDG